VPFNVACALPHMSCRGHWRLPYCESRPARRSLWVRRHGWLDRRSGAICHDSLCRL
jgi:hypothetical protein